MSASAAPEMGRKIRKIVTIPGESLRFQRTFRANSSIVSSSRAIRSFNAGCADLP
jgi:hypothetical protein